MTASMASRYSSATTTPDVMARAVAGGSSVDMLEWVFIRLGGFCLVKIPRPLCLPRLFRSLSSAISLRAS
ncbi:hypothetical protein KCV03_g296, partial [Aureobasidium melanogenum]